MPLRPTLVTGVTALILLTAGVVGFSSYLSSRRAVASLWHRAASETGQRVAQRTLRYLEPAVPYAKLTTELAEEGKLDPQNREALIEYLRSAVVANPSFTWASWGGADGAYIGVFRTPSGALQASWREVQGVDGNGKVLTRWRDFQLDQDGKWTVLKDVPDPYDPRTRPWYQAAASKKRGVWIEPFLFTSHQQPGFTYATPLLVKGELRGVFAVEFEVSYLSQFL
ncbi:MAG: PDC sensor domain-containing protein, partial [Deltaproteobacteria bacterium]|nr:PDC sensor domain-containing protein [Deltaproteobacteria bacterium]